MFRIIGVLAAVLTTSSFLPQAIKTIKTKNTDGISTWMYLMFNIGVFLWVLYGAHLKDIAIFSANLITLVLAMTILVYKIKSLGKKEIEK